MTKFVSSQKVVVRSLDRPTSDTVAHTRGSKGAVVLGGKKNYIVEAAKNVACPSGTYC